MLGTTLLLFQSTIDALLGAHQLASHHVANLMSELARGALTRLDSAALRVDMRRYAVRRHRLEHHFGIGAKKPHIQVRVVRLEARAHDESHVLVLGRDEQNKLRSNSNSELSGRVGIRLLTDAQLDRQSGSSKSLCQSVGRGRVVAPNSDASGLNLDDG